MNILGLLAIFAILAGTLVLLPAYFMENKPSPPSQPSQQTVTAISPVKQTIQAHLLLEPPLANFRIGQSKIFTLKVSFTNGSQVETLGYLKTTINFPKQYLQMPTDQYIDISQAGLDGVIRVTNPVEANQTGQIFIELGIGPNQSSGPATTNDLVIAQIPFKAIKSVSHAQITIKESQLYAGVDKTKEIPTTTEQATFSVGK